MILNDGKYMLEAVIRSFHLGAIFLVEATYTEQISQDSQSQDQIKSLMSGVWKKQPLYGIC